MATMSQTHTNDAYISLEEDDNNKYYYMTLAHRAQLNTEYLFALMSTMKIVIVC